MVSNAAHQGVRRRFGLYNTELICTTLNTSPVRWSEPTIGVSTEPGAARHVRLDSVVESPPVQVAALGGTMAGVAEPEWAYPALTVDHVQTLDELGEVLRQLRRRYARRRCPPVGLRPTYGAVGGRLISTGLRIGSWGDRADARTSEGDAPVDALRARRRAGRRRSEGGHRHGHRVAHLARAHG